MNPDQLKKICDNAKRNTEWPDGAELLKAGLFDPSSVLEVDRLVEFASRVQTRGAVTVSFATHDFVPLALIWAKAIQRCNITNYLIVCGDAPAYEILDAYGLPVIRAHIDTDTLNRNFSSKWGRTARQLAMSAIKFPVVGVILDHGFDVVMSDIDAIWCRDPYPFFGKDVDVAFQRVVYLPPAVVQFWGFAICSGFIYFKSSPAARSLLKESARWNTQMQSDQIAANLALLSLDIRWDTPPGYGQPWPMSPETATAQFSAFAGHSFRGVTADGQLTALALSHKQFWRHPFVTPSDMVICHPNSPRDPSEKLKVLGHWISDLG